MVVVLGIVVALWVLCAVFVVVLFLPELRRRETEAPRPQDDRSWSADGLADGRQRAASALEHEDLGAIGPLTPPRPAPDSYALGSERTLP
jgi:hypothetical protein